MIVTLSELEIKIGSMLEKLEDVTHVNVDQDTATGEVRAIFETADQRYTITGKKVTVKIIAMLPELEFDLEEYRRALWDFRTILGNVARAIRVYEMETSCGDLNRCERCKEPFTDGDAVSQGDSGLVHLRCVEVEAQ